jgi:hypothetical protein
MDGDRVTLTIVSGASENSLGSSVGYPEVAAGRMPSGPAAGNECRSTVDQRGGPAHATYLPEIQQPAKTRDTTTVLNLVLGKAPV